LFVKKLTYVLHTIAGGKINVKNIAKQAERIEARSRYKLSDLQGKQIPGVDPHKKEVLSFPPSIDMYQCRFIYRGKSANSHSVLFFIGIFIGRVLC